MIQKKNAKLFLTVLVLALIDLGVATRAATVTDDGNQKLLTASEAAGTYSIDPWHTNIGFRVRHMGLAIVLGEFKDYTAEVEEGMVVLDLVHQVQVMVPAFTYALFTSVSSSSPRAEGFILFIIPKTLLSYW